MNVAVLATLASLVVGLVGIGVKLGKAQADIQILKEGLTERPKLETVQGIKDEISAMRHDLDRRLDEKASAVEVRALKESVDLLRTDITTRLDSLAAVLSRRD